MADLLVALLGAAAWALAAEKAGAPAAPEPEAPPAVVGTERGPTEAAPVKTVEAPVFRLPEIVIVGENQARIMAQKESEVGSPQAALHEAPLLEKEESSVTALRRREVPPLVRAGRTGTGWAVALQGGGAGWVAGGARVGRTGERTAIGLSLAGARHDGAPVGTARAGGLDAQVEVDGSMRGKLPGWPAFLPGGHEADDGWFSLGFAERRRDLVAGGAAAGSRKLTHLYLAHGTSRASAGVFRHGRLETVRVRTPAGVQDAGAVSLDQSVHLWTTGSLALRIRPAVAGEIADASGDHFRAGGAVDAAFTPSERLRWVLGVSADGVFGGGLFAGSLRPALGAGAAFPSGINVAARFEPRLGAPWMARTAREAPYSVFASSLVPERELARLEVSAWRTRWDGSGLRAGYGYVETRGARSWLERSDGLMQPVALARLRVHTVLLGAEWRGTRNLGLTAEGRWRMVQSEGGQAALLPKGDGRIGAEWRWRTLVFGGDLEIVRTRPRSVLGGTLAPFSDLTLNAAWRPWASIEVFARGSNLFGQAIERWGGYPEPRHLLSAGLQVGF